MRAKRCFTLMLLLVLARPVISANARRGLQQPLYTLDISSLVPPGARSGVFDSTVAFLNNDSLAVGVCYKSTCNVATFRLEEKGLRQIGTLNGSVRFHAILKSGDGGVLLAGVQKGREKGAVLLNAGLEMPRWIPQSPGFSVFGEKMPEGRGLLLANAKGLAAFLDQQTVRIERSDGQVLGSFQVPSAKGRSSPTVIFLDKDRILFDPGGNPEVRTVWVEN